MRRTVVVATVVAFLVSLAGPHGIAQAVRAVPQDAPAAVSGPATRVAAEDDDVAARSTYRVRAGITLNNPLGSNAKKYAILNKIHTAIRNTPRGETIYVMSWNIMWMKSVDLLLLAQRRGVILRILMDEENFSREVPNPSWVKLRRSIASFNKRLPASRRSYAKVCDSACRRNSSGAAHAKYFLFTRVGASRNVVIQGGNNLTLASATNQWNEIYTFTEKPGLFAFMLKIFRQMWDDRQPAQPWVKYEDVNYDMYFSPQVGNYRVGMDPLEIALDNTVCKGWGGTTKVRAAPDVIRGTRGMRVAKKLVKLKSQGCDIRVAYTIMGKDVYKLLRSKGVPIRHLVQDFDGNKEFDRYFHLKVWTINGRVNGVGRYWALNGSTNISDYAAGSDENFAVFRNIEHITRRYQEHIDYWYQNPPKSRAVVPSLVKGPVDPYRNVDLD